VRGAARFGGGGERAYFDLKEVLWRPVDLLVALVPCVWETLHVVYVDFLVRRSEVRFATWSFAEVCLVGRKAEEEKWKGKCLGRLTGEAASLFDIAD
jgi:hypothetical protein